MSPRAKMVGRRFGKWRVEAFAGLSNNHWAMWQCKCDCGTERIVYGGNLRNGASTSCGCTKGRRPTHGETVARVQSVEFRTWASMFSRCNNPKVAKYKYYGARGIKVCERWREYENFLIDMGRRPGKGYSIDRINNDGNYEPGNCRWATWKQQANNQRKRVKKA